jgi:hypothetical protein
MSKIHGAPMTEVDLVAWLTILAIGIAVIAVGPDITARFLPVRIPRRRD